MENSNRSSLFFAILAIVLILGGVFYLNQQITQSNEDDSDSTSNIVAEESDDDSDQDVDPFSTRPVGQDDGTLDTDNDDLEQIDFEQQFGDSTDDDTDSTFDFEEDPDTIQEDPTPEPTRDDEVEETSDSDTQLSTNQMTLNTVSTSSTKNSFTVVDCGIPNATACVNGANIALSGISKFNVQRGTTYLVTADISETGGRISVTNIISMEPVN